MHGHLRFITRIALLLPWLVACGPDPLQEPSQTVSNAGGVFVDHDDGTITDTRTNLMWAKALAETPMAWTDARDYCATLNLGGHDDWRLPTRDELLGFYQSLGSVRSFRDRRIPPFAWADLEPEQWYGLWTSSRFCCASCLASS